MFSRWAMPALLAAALVILVRVLTLGTPNPALPEQNVINGLGFMWNPKAVGGGTGIFSALYDPRDIGRMAAHDRVGGVGADADGVLSLEGDGEEMIRAVLFDFGGVILPSPFEAFDRYERENGLPEGFIRRLNVANPDTNAWARLERNDVSFEEFCSLFEDEARAAGGRLDARAVMALFAREPRPEMVEAVRRCRERLKTGLLTNNWIAEDAPFGARPVLELFDLILESSRVGVRKPDPRFYEMACGELGISPSEAVFLDDLGVNLKSARQLGMTTIKVGDPLEAIVELEGVVGFPLR